VGGKRARLAEHFVDQRSLAMVDVGDDRDVSERAGHWGWRPFCGWEIRTARGGIGWVIRQGAGMTQTSTLFGADKNPRV
jgi:hypothetical protein